jgi:hypothetical protein
VTVADEQDAAQRQLAASRGTRSNRFSRGRGPSNANSLREQ